jgi:hypothetical protein
MDFTIYQGRIDITEPGGQTVEYENFILTANPDGKRTLRTLTRSPKGDLLRDATQLVTADWRPVDAMGRLYYKGVDCGTVVRRVFGDKLQSWAWDRDSEAVDYAEFDAPPKMLLGFHPIFHDAWKMCHLDTSHTDLQDLLTHSVSNTWNGRTLSHGQKIEGKARFEKTETIAVPAGEIECQRFYWHTSFGKDLRIWRTGPHHIFVRLDVVNGDKEGTVYELAELSETAVRARA